MNVSISYFAMLRERRGVSSETRETDSTTAAELYAELADEFGFSLPYDRIRVAVGTVYAQGDVPLEEGMELTFIPPVAGG